MYQNCHSRRADPLHCSQFVWTVSIWARPFCRAESDLQSRL